MDYVDEYLVPYYKGFKGLITKVNDHKYITCGCFDKKDKHTLIITELPIGIWNEPYLQYLEKCIDEKKYGIKDYKDLSTDKDVHIELTFQNQINLDDPGIFDKIIDRFKGISSLSTNNMYLFNKDEILTKYDSANDIINSFIETRMELYEKRKQAQITHLESLLKIYSNKYNFIHELLNDTIDLRKKKAQEIETLFVSKKYDKIENSFHYLIKMPMDMVNEENVSKLKNEYDYTCKSLETLKSTSITSMYYKELVELEKMI